MNQDFELPGVYTCDCGKVYYTTTFFQQAQLWAERKGITTVAWTIWSQGIPTTRYYESRHARADDSAWWLQCGHCKEGLPHVEK